MENQRATWNHVPVVSSAVAVMVAAIVLASTSLHLGGLLQVFAATGPLTPASAGSFALAAASLWLRLRDTAIEPTWRSRAGKACALLLMALGLAGVGLSLGAHGSAGPGLMPVNVAKNFVLLSAALLLLDTATRRGRRPSEWLCFLIVLVAFLALLARIYDIELPAGRTDFMPPLTAALFLVLALGVLCARPGTGIMAVISGADDAGRNARLLLSGMAAMLVVLGWLRIEGERRGLYDSGVGATLYTFAFIAIFGALVVWSATLLHRADVARLHALAERDRFFALSPDLLFVAGFDGYLKSLNPAWQQRLGITQAELLSRPLLEFVHPDDRATAGTLLQSITAGGERLSFEVRCRLASGDYRWFSWRAVADHAEGRVYGAARDISDSRQAEDDIRALNDQLLRTNRELEAFSYTISHDLRAPLRHIDGFAQMMREDVADQLDEQARRYLDVIGESARHMGVLIDELLAFSRLGKKPLERSRTDMRALAESALAEAAGGQPLAATVAIGTLPGAWVDPALLRQVWVNLLSNAIKYSTPRGGAARIEVSGEHADGVVRYRVNDNGVGFDMRYADKLFGVFQRLHAQEEFEGTGVGLAIVQRIVLRHGGRISFDAAPGAGATFVFELPDEPAQEEPRDES